MAKKELLVPFRNGRPCWWDGEVPSNLKAGEVRTCNNSYYKTIERKANYEFEASLKIIGFGRGRSSVKLCLIDINEPEPTEEYQSKFEYEVFLSDAIETITKAKDMVVSGTWTFTKRGANWGIKLI